MRDFALRFDLTTPEKITDFIKKAEEILSRNPKPSYGDFHKSFGRQFNYLWDVSEDFRKAKSGNDFLDIAVLFDTDKEKPNTTEAVLYFRGEIGEGKTNSMGYTLNFDKTFASEDIHKNITTAEELSKIISKEIEFMKYCIDKNIKTDKKFLKERKTFMGD